MGIRKVEEKAFFVTKAVSLTVVVLVLVTLCVFAQPVLASQISVEPECQIVPPGEYFTVNISVAPEGNETYAGSFTLYFNNTLLNASSMVNGTFLSHDGASTWITRNETDNTNGTIEYGECRKDVGYGVTENGTLATVTFEAIADGFCELRLSDLDGVILADPNGTSIPTDVNNGSVRIGLCGDVRKDGYITGWDISILNSYVAGIGELEPERKWAGDVRTDCYITGWDVSVLNNKVAGVGDISCMCKQMCPEW